MKVFIRFFFKIYFLLFILRQNKTINIGYLIKYIKKDNMMAIYKIYSQIIYTIVILWIVSFSYIFSFASERPDSKIVVEAYSGKVLYTESADAYRYPASLTKMMTLYLLFDELKAGRLKQSSHLKVSSKAAQAVPSKIGLKSGQTITVKDAIFALITKSANDVAITVAENIAGSESKFAHKMTQKARQLGMSRTTFKNASGLPHSQQRTTARDMATLGRMLLIHHGNYYSYFNTKSYTIGSYSYKNHNKLLGQYDGLDGIKTGYIKASGFNLVASAQRQDMRLVGVVIGGETSTSRNEMMVEILDKGFFRLAAARKTWITPKKRPNLHVASLSNESNNVTIDHLLDTALSVELPPERPQVTETQKIATNHLTISSSSQPSTDIISSIIDDRTENSFINGRKYSIELAPAASRNIAEQESRAALTAIQNLAPNGTAYIHSITDKSGSLSYKPIIQGLKGIDALTACQIIENQGKSCKITAPQINS